MKKAVLLALFAGSAHAYFGESDVPPGLADDEFNFGWSGRWEVQAGVYAPDLQSACQIAQQLARPQDAAARRPYAGCYPWWNGDPASCSHTNMNGWQGVMQNRVDRDAEIWNGVPCYSNTSTRWGSWTQTRNVMPRRPFLPTCEKRSRNDPPQTETFDLNPDGGNIVLFDVGKTSYNYVEREWTHEEAKPDGKYEFGIHLYPGHAGCQGVNPLTGADQCTVGFNEDWMYYVDPSEKHKYYEEPRYIVRKVYNAATGTLVPGTSECIEFTD